jgi:hypothetical protein
MTSPIEPTNAEACLAEQYVRVLDFVSRCAQAVDAGNWVYLADKARQLQDAAQGLARVSRRTRNEVHSGEPWPRPQVVAVEVAWHGRHHLAGRLLHPVDPQITSAGVSGHDDHAA